jgi:hypothetical protein
VAPDGRFHTKLVRAESGYPAVDERESVTSARAGNEERWQKLLLDRPTAARVMFHVFRASVGRLIQRGGLAKEGIT